jgi:hypothetical protein
MYFYGTNQTRAPSPMPCSPALGYAATHNSFFKGFTSVNLQNHRRSLVHTKLQLYGGPLSLRLKAPRPKSSSNNSSRGNSTC